MSDVPYYKPPVEGPMFRDDTEGIADEFSDFLAASDRDVSEAVAREDIKDMAKDSFKLWMQQKLEEMAIKPPKPK